MRPFTYDRPTGPLVMKGEPQGNTPGQAAWIAGGTTMLDLMKLDVLRPSALIDVNETSAANLRAVMADAQGLRLGALVTMAQAASDNNVIRDYPVLAQSLTLAASAQIRNMATLGGNVLQRTRCEYFRTTSIGACNKREPGTGCAALGGVNRSHAVLGTSQACIATYPGDLAQALMALDAQVEVANGGRTRTLAFADLHRAPGQTPHLENNLQSGDLITGFVIKAAADTRRSLYLKVRDRQSYQFALASAAVTMDRQGDIVRSVRIALGGVATQPWRAREAEQRLAGKPLDETAAQQAARAAFASAEPRKHNAFKVALGVQTLTRALLAAHAMEI